MNHLKLDTSQLALSTITIHGDRGIETGDIAPPIHVSTVYDSTSNYSYSRASQPTRDRVERMMGELEGGYATAYASGMAATSGLLFALNPKVIAIAKGYKGTKSGIEYFKRLTDVKILDLDECEFTRDIDLIWLESFSNPKCIVYDIKKYVAIARECGAFICVDSTFATPLAIRPLVDYKVDFVLHSASKYLGGHSDLLGGIIVTRHGDRHFQLQSGQINIGNMMGNMESWLLLRSLKTLSLRFERQSSSAVTIARWLNKQDFIAKVWHPSLKSHPSYKICKKQMQFYPACFAFEFETEDEASSFLTSIELIINATSLGGADTTVDWRHKHDRDMPKGLIRISIGLEDPVDIMNDLEKAFTTMYEQLHTE